jgi:hypothetical protein
MNSPDPEEARMPTKEGDYVLVKGWHDSGNIDGVYGPYSWDQANWLLDNIADSSINNWSVIELLKFA